MECNLIVDTNFLLYKNAYALHKNKTLYGDLEESLHLCFQNYISKYPFRNIFLVADSRKSWRKEINKDYKSTRKKDDDIDWEFVFNTYEQFKEDVKENNKLLEVVEEEYLEGDDIIYKLVKESNDKEISTLIVASDADLQQLLEFRTNPLWINIQWRDNLYNSKIFLPESYPVFLDALDNSYNKKSFFDMTLNDDFKKMLDDFFKNNVYEEVNAEKNLFIKIVQGDKSDNIKSVLETPTKKNPEKFQGIGEKGAEKIYHNFKADNPDPIDFTDDTWINDVLPYVAEYKKVDLEEYEKNIIENLNKNRQLIYLHNEQFPEKIQEKLEKINID